MPISISNIDYPLYIVLYILFIVYKEVSLCLTWVWCFLAYPPRVGYVEKCLTPPCRFDLALVGGYTCRFDMAFPP